MNPPNTKAVKSKASTSKQPVKRGTGVASVKNNDSYPPSTNVSSPVRATSKRRNIASKRLVADDSDDGFVVSDSENSENDGFEPVRGVPSRPSFGKRQATIKLGPPITTDEQLARAGLSDVHVDMIRQFVQEAKALDEHIRNERGNRKPLFTEMQLRAMAIHWTTTMAEMAAIEGISQENVAKHAKKFIPLVERHHRYYGDVMAGDVDKSHQNVIELSSGDESVEDVEDVEEEMSDEADERSSYFAPEHVRKYNERMNQTPEFKASNPSKGKGRASNFASSRRAPRRSGGSASSSGRKPYSGVKKKTASKPASSSSKRAGGGGGAANKTSGIMEKFGKKPGSGNGGGGRGGEGGSGIAMMPT